MAHPTTLHAHDHGNHGGHEHHIVPVSTYLGVFAGLMVLLVLTLVAAYFDLGAVNLPLAMVIAIAKAYLVMAYFMHLKWSSRLVVLFATIAFAFLAILGIFSMNDYLARGWVPMPRP
jgi:cytochrome c oxidase subunit 4